MPQLEQMIFMLPLKWHILESLLTGLEANKQLGGQSHPGKWEPIPTPLLCPEPVIGWVERGSHGLYKHTHRGLRNE